MDAQWFKAATELSAVGREARGVAWDRTPLGPPSTWPLALRHAVRLCFSTRFPVMLAWGPDLRLIYNDGYRDMIGAKHPSALGAPARRVWAEVWDDIGPLFERVLSTGEPTWTEDMVLLMNRSGFVEETMFTFSYGPLLDDEGNRAGVLDIAAETTQQVRTRRRLATLDQLHVSTPATFEDFTSFAASVMSAFAASADIARAAFYLTTTSGVELLAETSPASVPLVEYRLVDDAVRSRQTIVSGATVASPLRGGLRHEAAGALVLEASPLQPMDPEYLRFLSVACASVSSALQGALRQREITDTLRERAERSEQESARVRTTSLALQHAVLTPPPEPDHLHVAVRYQPAAEELEIGGDWYDAFLTRDGATVLVVGDVVGHDLDAAVMMGQVRGVVRTIGYDNDGEPALTLQRADDALHGLALGDRALSTLVVARIEQPTSDGVRRVRWSSAGHPPPVVVRADGTVEVLWRRNDLPLGLVRDAERAEHTVELADGDTFVLYTDGLVERRDIGIRDSLDEFSRALEGTHEHDLNQFADTVLAKMVPGAAEDDIAIVAVRPYPADRPRPPEAGPNRGVPPELR